MRATTTVLTLSVLGIATAFAGAQTGSYTTFGSGCRGSGSGSGACTVLPKAYATKMGQIANTFPHARAGMRYQQVFLGSEIGGAKLFTELCLRLDERFGGPAQTQTIELRIGQTPKTPANLVTNFASNYGTRAPTTVFKGTLSLPAHTNGGGIQDFKICLKFSSTYVWVPTPNQNLLTEWINTSASSRSHFEDKCQGSADCTTTRIWATSATATTATGTERNGGLIMCFRSRSGGAVPALSNTGVPTIGRSFRIDLSGALAQTAAGLILGASNTRWGSFRLPLSLAPFGASGCQLLASFDLVGGAATSASGTASVAIGIPNVASLVGVVFHNQWFVVDANANTLGAAWSNGGTARIGR